MPLYDHELTDQIDPFQAGLGFACYLRGVDFPGRDALVEIERQSPRAVRAGLEFSGRRVPRQGYPVLAGSEQVGQITSGHVLANLAEADRHGLRSPGVGRRGERKFTSMFAATTSPPGSSHFPSTTAKQRKSAVKPEDMRFAKTHEWVHVANDASGAKIATVGITAFALEALTDLVFIDLPPVGRRVEAGRTFGEVESVKAVSDLYSPVDGEVLEVNVALHDHLESLASDPYGTGWLVKIKVSSDANLAKLLSYEEYKKQCTENAG